MSPETTLSSKFWYNVQYQTEIVILQKGPQINRSDSTVPLSTGGVMLLHANDSSTSDCLGNNATMDIKKRQISWWQISSEVDLRSVHQIICDHWSVDTTASQQFVTVDNVIKRPTKFTRNFNIVLKPVGPWQVSKPTTSQSAIFGMKVLISSPSSLYLCYSKGRQLSIFWPGRWIDWLAK